MINKELIKELFTEANMMSTRANEIIKNTNKDIDDLELKAVKVITKYFDEILDCIDNSIIYPEFNYTNASGYEKIACLSLKNKIDHNGERFRYATIKIRDKHNTNPEILVSSNNEGILTDLDNYENDLSVNNYFNKYRRNINNINLINEDCKNTVLYLFSNYKNEMDKAIMDAIKEEVSRTLAKSSEKISSRANYLNTLNNIVTE